MRPGQFGVHPFLEEGCTTCRYFTHHDGRCHSNDPKNSSFGVFVGEGLSPCEKWRKGFEFVPGTWGKFRRVKEAGGRQLGGEP